MRDFNEALGYRSRRTMLAKFSTIAEFQKTIFAQICFGFGLSTFERDKENVLSKYYSTIPGKDNIVRMKQTIFDGLTVLGGTSSS